MPLPLGPLGAGYVRNPRFFYARMSALQLNVLNALFSGLGIYVFRLGIIGVALGSRVAPAWPCRPSAELICPTVIAALVRWRALAPAPGSGERLAYLRAGDVVIIAIVVVLWDDSSGMPLVKS